MFNYENYNPKSNDIEKIDIHDLCTKFYAGCQHFNVTSHRTPYS